MGVFLLVMVMVIFYGTMFGYTYRTNLERAIAYHGCDNHCRRDHTAPAFFGAIAWPFGLPASITMHAESKGTRAENRRKEELTEARHKISLAQLKADETEALNRQLEAAHR